MKNNMAQHGTAAAESRAKYMDATQEKPTSTCEKLAAAEDRMVMKQGWKEEEEVVVVVTGGGGTEEVEGGQERKTATA